MVQALPSSSTNSLKVWPTMKFSPTSLPPLWSNAPYPFADKRRQTIATSLWLHQKIFIQTILETLSNFLSSMHYKEFFCSIKKFGIVMWQIFYDHCPQAFDVCRIVSMKCSSRQIFLQPLTCAWLKVGHLKV